MLNYHLQTIIKSLKEKNNLFLYLNKLKKTQVISTTILRASFLLLSGGLAYDTPAS